MAQNNPMFLGLWQQITQFVKDEIARQLRTAGIVGGSIDASYVQGSFSAGLVSIPASGSQVLQALETIPAGSVVNIASGGMQLADASLQLPAAGFVLSAVTSGNYGTAYSVGLIGGLTGRTTGATQYLSTGGTLTETAPTATGAMLQVIGSAISATQVSFMPQPPVIL